MSDNDSPEGMRILYDLLVKASEFPGDSNHNVRNLYTWGEKLKALHQMISAYHDEEYTKEYFAMLKQGREVSKKYPSQRYIHDGYDVFFEWLGSISRLYSRLGLMIPENLTYTEGGDEGI
jgi:hypothetical protein